MLIGVVRPLTVRLGGESKGAVVPTAGDGSMAADLAARCYNTAG